jgi:GT2 family glycosyltransferase
MALNLASKNCALVVTYNRPDLLVRCINSLLTQTKKLDGIIIIDNGSEISTLNILINHHYIKSIIPSSNEGIIMIEHDFNDTLITYYKLEQNKGPGFAFNFGCKVFFKSDYDWLWMMDDDGFAHNRALENLEMHKEYGDFLNPLVLDIENKDNLAFGLYLKDRKKLIITEKDAFNNSASNLLFGVTNPFNGTFISKKLISKIGYPLAEMYGWGVEVEYEKRAIKHGFSNITICSSFHYHPKSRVEHVSILNGRYKLNYQSNRVKNYIEMRNNAYIKYRYDGIVSVIKYLLSYSIFFLYHGNLKDWFLFINALFDGFFSKWENEKRFH